MPEPENPTKDSRKDYLKEKTKAFSKATIGGATVSLIFGVIAFFGSLLGMKGLSLSTAGDLVHAIEIRDGYVILWIVGAVLLLFGFFVIWSKFEHKIGMLLHEKKEMALEGQDQHDVKKLRQIKYVPRILFGLILTILIPTGFSVYQSMTGTNLEDLHAMTTAFETLSIPSMITYIIGFAGIGYIAYWIFRKFPDFEKRLGKKLDRF